MISNISLVTVYCLDQDQARDFYVENLNFETRTDITMGEGYRWLSRSASPSEPSPSKAMLHAAGPAAGRRGTWFIRGQLEKGQMGGLGLKVDDCRKAYQELSAKGVTFLQEPAERPYGIEAVMRDNTGNWLVLVEPRSFTPEDFK